MAIESSPQALSTVNWAHSFGFTLTWLLTSCFTVFPHLGCLWWTFSSHITKRASSRRMHPQRRTPQQLMQ
eukprot:924717-Prorocentrum_lima.AAC.1